MGVLIFAVVTGLVASMIYGELAAWAPRIAAWIVDRAVAQLPLDLRERLREEWRALLEETPGVFGQIFCALNLSLAGLSISCNENGRTIGIRCVDLFLAAFLMVFFAPLVFFLCVALAAEGREGLFLRREAIGRNGSKFDIYTFRTKRSGRRTALGVFMERASLNDLPIIYSVFKGDLAFIGAFSATEAVSAYSSGIPAPSIPSVLGRNSFRGFGNYSSFSKCMMEYRRRPSVMAYIKLIVSTVPFFIISNDAFE